MNYTAFCSMCFLLFGLNVQAQNLVPNGSFEDGDPCPTATGEVHYLDHWYLGVELPFPNNDWWNWPSPDWYHECTSNPNFQPPNVIGGFQEPFLGDGFVGIITHQETFENYREIVSVQLNESLIVGELYEFSFKAVLAMPPFNQGGGASNNLGMKLTTYSKWYAYEGPVQQNWAHYAIEAPFQDTTNWQSFSYQFVADSAYTHLHLGNFFNDSSTTIVSYDEYARDQPMYFVDDVSLVKPTLNTSVGGKDFEHQLVFPNPASDHVIIPNLNLLQRITILDVQGQAIIDQVVNGESEYRVDLSGMSQGMYIIKALDSKGENHFFKIIKN